jgi:hypothetical protein
MTNIFLVILMIIVIYILIIIYEMNVFENFTMYSTYQGFYPFWNGYSNFPFNNTNLGTTKNMSYDLRGDPLVIPRTQFPWNNSSIYPIYNNGI